jgi:proteasome assembly chaperone (PAC2) family protein
MVTNSLNPSLFDVYEKGEALNLGPKKAVRRMTYDTFHLEQMPSLTAPVMIIGLRGWGNALEVSSEMAAYLVDALDGRAIGRIDADRCYRYDDNRPEVQIESGRLTAIKPPGGTFFAVETKAGDTDLMVLIADEPSLNWHRFSQELVDLAHRLEAPAVISLGSMFDHVLHTDCIVSAATTGDAHAAVLDRHGVIAINYHGPSAIHTLILDACRRQGVFGASLWAHCPAYLQGVTHHGLMLTLAQLIGDLASFSLDTDILESRWSALETQIKELIADNPKLAGIVDQIRKKKREGAWQNLGKTGEGQGNVINLRDFIDS